MAEWIPNWAELPWWGRGAAYIVGAVGALIALGWLNGWLSRDDSRPLEWHVSEIRKLLTVIAILLAGILLHQFSAWRT